MGSLLSRSVEIQITNRTQDIILRNPRMYFECGSCSEHPVSQLLPGSSDTCRFRGATPFWGIAGILVYEAESFTLAIYFSNPIDHNKFSMEMGLELSPSKAHQGRLGNVYARMAKGAYSSSCSDIKFDRVILDRSYRTAQVRHGPVKVKATMSDSTISILRVVLEEQTSVE